ncbi:MAG: hypothetical protein JWO33_2066 [Caulobacteraceae bacterium]|nr:hypothetical protein [Caulobacteraceae bacterium]
MTAEEFRIQALDLPGVEEGFNMGSAVFKANGKVLARLLENDRVMLTGYAADEIDVMVEVEPALFDATPHFRDAGCIAARLDRLDPAAAHALLARRFRTIAKKAVIKAWDAGN